MTTEIAIAKKTKGPKARPEFLASLKGAGTPTQETPTVRVASSQAAASPPPQTRARVEEVVTTASSSGHDNAHGDSPSGSSPISPSEEPTVEERASIAEIVEHAAIDSIFYCHHFFPKTFRQDSAPFHPDLWSILDDPAARYVNVVIGRDGAKTTILRAFAAKRIAYGISRTILYVGASQDKAKQSVSWLKNQILRNTYHNRVFGLEAGKPYTDEHIVIKHGTEGHEIHVLAYGITGSTRGVNLDDWRPDLIIIDDCMNEENSATPDARQKIIGLVLGSLKESLSPASESPDAKMVLLNTPQDFEDLSQEALKDTQFRSARYGCWTSETEELPVELQESAWEARYPTIVLREEKKAAVARNKYSIFAREKECLLVTPETSIFRSNWLQYYGENEAEPEPLRNEMWVEMAIDPVPPPSDAALAKGRIKTDFEAFSICGRRKGKYYLLDSVYNRGHEPTWTVATFMELCHRWNPRKISVETVAYQRTLMWLLKEAMRHAGRYWVIVPFDDKRKKFDVINDGLSGVSSNGQLFIRRSHVTFASQFLHYPGKNPKGTYDDVLDSTARCLTSLAKGHIGDIADDHYLQQEEDVPALEYSRGAP